MKLPLEKSDQKMSQHMRTSKTGKVFTAGVGAKAQPKVTQKKITKINPITLKYAKAITNSLGGLVNSDWGSFGHGVAEGTPIQIGKYKITPMLQADRNQPADLYINIEGLENISPELEKYMVGDSSIGIGQAVQDGFKSKATLQTTYKILKLLGKSKQNNEQSIENINPKMFSFKLKDARNQYELVVYSAGNSIEEAKKNLKTNFKTSKYFNRGFKKLSTGRFLGNLNDMDPEEKAHFSNGLITFEPEPIES